MNIFLHFLNIKGLYNFIVNLPVIKKRHFLVSQVHQKHIKKHIAQILCVLIFSAFNTIAILNYNELFSILV